MAGQRPLEPKADKKVAEQTVTIQLQEFLRTRDSVVSGLTTLIGVIHELNTAYLKHTSDLLSAGGLAPEVLTQYAVQHYLNPQGKGALLSGGIPGLNADLKVKKKRAKKEKDPNAPKRPLTAYFLYSIHARPDVKKDLGDSATPVEVNNEILKRWKEMSADKKEIWKVKYEENNKQYKLEVAAYKAKTGVDPEAVVDAHDGAEEVEEDDDDEDEEEEPAKPPPPPPAKAKKAKATKSKAKENGAAPAILSPSPSAQLRVTETPASAKKADKKRKADKDVVEPKKKKAKADAKEAPAPVATKEKKKKKGKGEA